MQHEQNKQRDYILTGTITRIISHNPRTGYSLLEVSRSKTPRRTEFVIVHLPNVYVGVKMQYQGEWRLHNGKTYFYSDFVYELQPKTLTEIRKYLSSKIFEDRDRRLAKKVVRHFKDKTFDMLNNPDTVTDSTNVKGVPIDDLYEIINSWIDHKPQIEIMHFLQEHGLTCSYAVQAYKRYGDDTIEKVQENPYQLLQDFKDISFKEVDSMSLSIGIATDSRKRIIAAISQCLVACQDLGHCYLRDTEISKYVKRLLDVDISQNLSDHLQYMQEQHLVKSRVLTPKGLAPKACYYEPSVFEDELYIARRISRNNIPPEVDLERIKELVRGYQASEPNLSTEHVDAVIGTVCSKYSVLAGGPGTGKVASLKAIVHTLKAMDLTFHLVAPTGRVTQRMKEHIGVDVQTIHRLLDWQYTSFRYNEKTPLETDFIIINESSMLDIHLAASLLRAVPDTSQVLFVGDPDQLPTRGAGDVFKDIIDSNALPVYQMTRPFHQAADSMIIRFANQLKMGLSAKLLCSEIERMQSDSNPSDCFFLFSEMYKHPKLWEDTIADFVNHCPYPVQLDESIQVPDKSKSNFGRKEFSIDLILNLYQELSNSDDSPDIQILTSGITMASSLNLKIQNAVNPYDPRNGHLGGANNVLRVGDRVILCEKDFGRGVFKDQIGIVEYVGNEEPYCSVEYPEYAEYTHKELDKLDLAYAITVDQSPRSEFDIVIIHLEAQGLSRQMLYTAMTKAKKLVVFVGSMGVFTKAVENRYQPSRQTGLKHLLLGKED